MTCSIEGCGNPQVFARGWCRKHYGRWQRTGSPEILLRRTGPELFWERVDVAGPEECWLWTGWTSPEGYGRVWLGRTTAVQAHRWSWQLEHGPVPEGMALDHRCHNAAALLGECIGGWSCTHRRCVNPAHLAPVTLGENTKASPLSPSTINAAKTHCVHGHEFTPENTVHRPEGGRWCLTCRRRISRESAQRSRDARKNLTSGAVR